MNHLSHGVHAARLRHVPASELLASEEASEGFETPFGVCVVYASEEHVTRVVFDGSPRGAGSGNRLTRVCILQLKQYLQGRRRAFDLPLDQPNATPFQRRVYRELLKIPYGETRTYKEVAHALGCKAYRAVGSACSGNALQIVVPCHRVVSSTGLGGYASGTEMKARLLRLEGVAKYL